MQADPGRVRRRALYPAVGGEEIVRGWMAAHEDDNTVQVFGARVLARSGDCAAAISSLARAADPLPDTGSGPIEAATIRHVVGALAGLVWFGVGLRGLGFGQLGSLPWWAWLGGVVGLTAMAAATKAMPVVGVSAAMGLIVAGQFGVNRFSFSNTTGGWGSRCARRRCRR